MNIEINWNRIYTQFFTGVLLFLESVTILLLALGHNLPAASSEGAAFVGLIAVLIAAWVVGLEVVLRGWIINLHYGYFSWRDGAMSAGYIFGFVVWLFLISSDYISILTAICISMVVSILASGLFYFLFWATNRQFQSDVFETIEA